MSKKDVELGFRDVEAFNVALLAKQSWRIATKPVCLLSKVLLGKYCKDIPFDQVTATNSASHGWRSILCGRDLLLTNCGKIIGDGKDTSIWDEPWLSTSSPRQPMGPAPLQQKDWKVADLICETTGSWKREAVEALLPDDAPDIFVLRPSKTKVQDKFCWLKTGNGEFTTKSGYHIARSLQKPTPTAPQTTQVCDWNVDIWNIHTSPKLQVFLWKVVKGAMALGENLEKRGIISSAQCTFCGQRETAAHLFLHCQFTVRVWNMVPVMFATGITNAMEFVEGLKASKRTINLPPSGLSNCPIFPWICWTIWTTRNQKIFESRIFSAEDVASKAIRDAREWQNAQQPPPTVRHFPGPRNQHTRLDPEVITVSTDAAWNETKRLAGLGWILTDFAGNTLHKGCKVEEFVSSPAIAEGLAIREAITHCLEQGHTKVTVNSDAQTLIRAINGRDSPKELFGITTDIRNVSFEFSVISFSFIPRTNNLATDTLAKCTLAGAMAATL